MTSRVVSGMRPTGPLHLGNLLGAVRQWTSLQDGNECFFFVADWHALTTPGRDGTPGADSVALLNHSSLALTIDLIAAGLDPVRSVIFLQSDVPEVAELHLLLSMYVNVSRLLAAPTYREKTATEQVKHPSYGLLGYPVLQAADILAYRGELVPVGKDQTPHLHYAEEIAHRFNALVAEVFPIPRALLTSVPRVPGLDGFDSKMSKTLMNDIALHHSEQETEERVLTMFTDPRKVRRTDPGHPVSHVRNAKTGRLERQGCVAFFFHEICDPEKAVALRSDCEAGNIGCVDCKRSLAASMNQFLAPLRAQRSELVRHMDDVMDVLRHGALRAREAAQETLAEVRHHMGLRAHID